MDKLHFYYFDWYNKYKRGVVKESTLFKYIYLEKILYNLNIELKEVNFEIYQKILNDYSLNKHRNTVINLHRILSSFFNYLFEEKIIDKFSLKRVVVKGKEKNNRKNYLDKSEVMLLIRKLNLRENSDLIIYVLLKTGLRFSECMGITKDDIDFKYGLISINKALKYKGNIEYENLKNRNSYRVIKIDNKLKNILKEVVLKKENNEPIFLERGKKIYLSSLNKKLKRLTRSDMTIHGLRHTHASLLLFGNVDISIISRRLGHKSVRTTQEIYLHIIREFEERNNKEIEKVMGEF